MVAVCQIFDISVGLQGEGQEKSVVRGGLRQSRAAGGTHFDVVVIGSGFGGSVSALRLTEKGYRVGVVEAGRRFNDDDFAQSAWQLNKLAFAPKLGMFGLYRVHLLRNVGVLAAAGVGGGSLNYANTLYRPPSAFFEDPQWSGITNWEQELAPHYDQAERMLGVVINPLQTYSDQLMKEVAEDMGVSGTFVPTPVGVFFGADPAAGARGVTVPDPFFGGVGPGRVTCTECGCCMTGCRVGAKNTLVKNYLGLAEQAGAVVLDRTTVVRLTLQDSVWRLDTRRSGAWGPIAARSNIVTADHVVIAAGTYNTQRLLHRAKDRGDLPNLSSALGRHTRTNSESILCATQPKFDIAQDTSTGVAITSSFHPRPDTHIEPVRFGAGFNAIGALFVPLSAPREGMSRWRSLMTSIRQHPAVLRQLMSFRRRAQRSIIVLAMQHRNNSLTTFVRRRGPLRYITSRQGDGEPNPTWIPVANEVTERAAEKLGGYAGGAYTDLLGVTLTAHYLGGCAVSETPRDGVVDPYQRVWGYPTLHVMDGSAISANPGVNPSLTIASQAERAISLWPNKSDQDQRPSQGQPYRRIDRIWPRNPVVPEHARAALRTAKAIHVPGRSE